MNFYKVKTTSNQIPKDLSEYDYTYIKCKGDGSLLIIVSEESINLSIAESISFDAAQDLLDDMIEVENILIDDWNIISENADNQKPYQEYIHLLNYVEVE